MKIQISQIKLGNNKAYRGELKNIAKLAKSMAKPNGQLQAICVDSSYELIFGLRRLEAAKQLGWTEIEATIVDLDNPLEAIFEENDDREDWPISDKVKLGKRIEAYEAEKARERQRKAGPIEGPGAKPSASGNLPKALKPDENQETGRAKDKAAEVAGMSRHTYEKAAEVVEAAKTNPAVVPIVEEMDRTGKVAPAHRKLEAVAPKEPKPPKPGKPVTYKLNDFDTHFGALMREIDKCGNIYKVKESPEAKKLRSNLGAFRESFLAWVKEVSK